MSKLIEHNPLGDSESILRDEFYGKAPQHTAPTPAPVAKKKKPQPTHYKIVCISLYTKDIERLDSMVKELKERGHTKANKSAIIRYALDNVDLTRIPKTY